MTQTQPIDINLLPEPYRPFRLTPRLTLLGAGLILLIIGLLPAALALRAVRLETNALQDELQTIEQQIEQTQGSQEEIDQINTQI